MDSIYNHSCIPLITKPTRVTSTSASLIDNIFSNILPPPNSGILVTDISDHFPIFTTLPSTHNSYRQKPVFVRQHSEDNLHRFKSDLNSTDWSQVYNSDDCDVSCNNFMNIFHNLYDKNIPLRRLSQTNRKHQPRSQWITPTLLKSINHKNKLYHKYCSSPNDLNRCNYTRYRNVLTSTLRLVKINFFANQFEKEKNNSRNTWKLINSILKNDVSSKLSSIKLNNQCINDPHL